MKRIKINRLTGYDTSPGTIQIKGWVRTRRDAKGFSFMEINDGSCLGNIQVVAGSELPNYTDILAITTGSAVGVCGALVPSPGKGQKWEIQAQDVEIISLAPETYPLQKKRHSDEFLRTIAHLRPRTNKYGATFRIRSEMVYAIHRFYKEKGFFYLTSPVITGSDCEGAGEMFRVTSLDPAAVANRGKWIFQRIFSARNPISPYPGSCPPRCLPWP
jgi:asparaginyl-tRNA synthetase